MSRIPPAKAHGLDLIRRLTYAWAKRMYKREMEPLGALAHHRPSLVGLSAISLASERFSKAVDEHLKHLARLRSAQLIGCEWCLDFGSWLAQRSGLDEDKLRELSTWRESSQFDAVERLVLEYTDRVTRTPVEVSDELFSRLREHFDEGQLIELTMAITTENLYSRTNWALGIEGEGFSEGMYCVAPERPAAALAAE